MASDPSAPSPPPAPAQERLAPPPTTPAPSAPLAGLREPDVARQSVHALASAGRGRVALGSLALAFAVALLAARGGPLDPPARVAVVALAGALGFATRLSLRTLALRRGRICVDGTAPAGSSVDLAAAAAASLGVAGALSVAALALARPAHPFIAVGSTLSAALAAAIVLPLRAGAQPPVNRTAAEVAAHAAALGALLAGTTTVAVGYLRLRHEALVSPAELGRHLGAATLLYAVVIGAGAAVRTFTAAKAGALVCVSRIPAAPGPVVIGGTLGVAFLFAVPWLAPALPLADALVVKGVVAACCGGVLGATGALRGLAAQAERANR